jgi:hypothetical protein
MKLQSLSISINGLDISGMVLHMTIFETIKGMVRGNFIVQDNINFYDTFISETMVPINIISEYLEVTNSNTVYADGVTNMTIGKLGKQYTVHFIAFTTANMKLARINKVFSGTSSEIISKLFLEANGDFHRLAIDTVSDTKGRYIVPNITAQAAIKNVVNTAYDTENSGFCLYQRVADQGVTRLSTLNYMAKNYFYSSPKDRFTIKNTLVGANADDDGLSTIDTVGTSSQFILEEYQNKFIDKLAAGHWGKKIKHIELDKTNIEKTPPTEYTELELTAFKLSENLYEDNVKSLFSTTPDAPSISALNQKSRVFNQSLRVSNMVAIPYIGVGFCVKVDQGGSNISKSKADTNYIVANINHKFKMDDGKFEYLQDIGLIRE